MTIVADKKKLILGIIVALLVVVLGGVIFFTVYKTSNREKTVAPTVPQIKPQAAEPNCSLAFNITETVTPTPVYQCDSVCSTSSQCPSGLICNASRCRNAGCVDRNNCVCITPAPTISPVCNSPCSSASQCPSGMTCNSGFCRNPSCVTQSNCVCNVVTVTPPPVPVSGWEIPTTVVSLGGVVLLLVAKLLL